MSLNSREISLILLGAGGHAKVLLELAKAVGYSTIAICDPYLASKKQTEWRGFPVLGGDEALASVDPESVGLINGIGQLVGSRVRRLTYERMRDRGFRFPSLIHPSAWVSSTASLSDGAQVMAGAIIQPDCNIGENSIVNTGATIDHDCVISNNVHIAPGATLCGAVRVEAGAFIGTGAVIIQGVRVGADSVVGAGVTLTRDLESRSIRIGSASRVKLDLNIEN